MDGRPNRRYYAAFSNCSGVKWTGPGSKLNETYEVKVCVFIAHCNRINPPYQSVS